MDLPFRYEFDDPYFLQAADPDGMPALEVTPIFDGRVSVIHCRARMDGERVGMDAELAVALRTQIPAPFAALTEADFGDEVTRRRGEYVICFPAPTDSLWTVAKRYHAPIAALTAANNIPAGADVSTPESLDGAGYLIV